MYVSMLKEGSFNPNNPLSEEDISDMLLTFTISKEELEHGIPVLKIEYPTKEDRQLYMDHWSKNHYIPDNENSSERLFQKKVPHFMGNLFILFLNIKYRETRQKYCI